MLDYCFWFDSCLIFAGFLLDSCWMHATCVCAGERDEGDERHEGDERDVNHCQVQL